MPDLSTCPSAEELRQLAAGQLPAARAQELTRHLQQCPRCRANAPTPVVSETVSEAARREAPAEAEAAYDTPPPPVLRIGREVAEGLAAAHARGLIHRDIKPGNVWLEGEPGASATGGRVKLLDFGLARPVTDDLHLTQTGMIVGTPAYMSPEQTRAEVVGTRSDLFSLGVVLYRMATGELPFKGKDTLSTLQALATQTPAPARQLSPEVPAALSDLIGRLLDKAPAKRPASARAVAAELAVIAAAPAGRPRKAPPRRRLLGAAAALAVIAGLVGLIVVIIRDRQGREVARVEVPEGGTVEVRGGDRGTPKAKETPRPADRARPFVLLRKGVAREDFKHLAGALAVVRDGDAIEVHGNGPFTVPAVLVTQARLVLKAAPGYRPQFVATTPANLHQGIWLDLRGGALLEGCDFRASNWYAGLGGPGDWEVRNCRFFARALFKLCEHKGARLRVTDSLLFGTANSVFDLAAKDQVELTNNVLVFALWPADFLHFTAPGGQVVRCTRNTVVCYPRNGALLPDPGCTEPVVVEAAGNLLQGGPLTPDLKARGPLRWKGRDNLYVGPEVFRAPGAAGKGGPADLAVWNKLWGGKEEGPRQAEAVSFRLDALDALPSAEALPAVQAAAERLLKGHAGPADRVGPDWRLLGPGEAYVRALAADKDRRGPAAPRLDRLRPEAPPGGPFVILRAGKEVSGYVSLQQALDATRKDDVVEIRTDGPFPGGAVRGLLDLNLTVRAAPGYRPVLSGDLHHEPPDGNFRLEGLTFDEGHLTGDFRNLTVCNCAFRTMRMLWLVGYSVRGPGGPVVFRNCILSRGIGAKLDKGRALLVENCVAPAVGYEPAKPGQPCPILLRHSALWLPGPRGGVFFYRPKDPVSVRAEQSLFVSGAVLGSRDDGGPRAVVPTVPM